MWAKQKPFPVAVEGSRRLKQNTKNTQNTRMLTSGDVCHIQCLNCAEHKHQIKDW